MHIREIDDETAGRTPDSLLSGLDPDQRAAVTAPVGVVVVRAGAGSGKTTVLTRRIAWRVANATADADRMLAITFTRQAATEMRARLARHELDGRPVIGTFHAVARRLMMQQLEDKGRQAPVIINNRSSVMSMCMGDDARSGGVNDVLAAVDWCHARMIQPSQAAKQMNAAGMRVPLGDSRFTDVFDSYEKTKKKRGVVDLNDFLTAVVRDATKDPRFAESIRFQFRHVCVDEAQDMNPLQYEFLKVLLPSNPDLFLVGDSNQAIFGFNGADRSLFDLLPGIDAPATVLSLPSNYRCTPEIVGFAVNTLARDGQNADAKSRRANGSPVGLQRHPDETAETSAVVKEVLRASARGVPWSDMAVLTRVNATANIIRDALTGSGIPVRSARRGGSWGRAVGVATALTSREGLAVWAADVLDTGEYDADDADVAVAHLVRRFLDDNRVGSVDGRAFGSWLATTADVEESDGVDVLSFHAAKGREWSFVVVAGMEKGLLPHRSARSAAARSEEARLAYVALTRAADNLVVTWTDSRNNKASGPSPFLPSVTTDIPRPAPPPEEIRRLSRSRPVVNSVETMLAEWRDSVARRHRVEPEAVLSARALRRLAKLTSPSLGDIADCVDPVFANRHGVAVIDVINRSQG